MKEITAKEALDQGYVLCGYEDLEYQNLKAIDQLEEEDYQPYCGRLCVAKKESNSVSISNEDVIEWLTERYFDAEMNPDDDDNDIQLLLKKQEKTICDFVYKMNEVFSEKKWWYLDSDLKLVIDK